MTLEEFHKQEWKRFKSLLFGTAIFLSITIPVIIYNGPPTMNMSLAVVLATMFSGTVASWASYDELRKAVKTKPKRSIHEAKS